MAYQPLDTTIIEGSENEGHIGLVNKSEHLSLCDLLHLELEGNTVPNYFERSYAPCATSKYSCNPIFSIVFL